MESNMKISIGIFLLAVGWVFYQGSTQKPPLDWSPSFSEKHKTPFGTYVLRSELKTLFSSIRTKSIEISSSILLKDSTLEGTYIFINDSINFDKEELGLLFEFVERGNDVFIATNAVHLGGLNIETKSLESRDLNEFIRLELVNPNLNAVQVYLKNELSKVVFKNFDTLATEVLGRITVFDSGWNSLEEQVNFIRCNMGKGNFYFHLFPEAFTNYGMLEQNNHQYVASVLSYLDDSKPIFWDEYHKSGKPKVRSPMHYILSSKSLKWSYYTALIGIVLFIIFEGKRNQRAIPILHSLKNQSIEFTRTIASLYYEKSDHTSIANQIIVLFFDYVRTQLLISPMETNRSMYQLLAEKTGNKKESIKFLFEKIKTLQSQKKPLNVVSKEQLLELNTLIEQFKINYKSQKSVK